MDFEKGATLPRVQFQLRPATAADLAFVKELFHESMGRYVEKALFWDEEEQFRAMERWFKPERVLIICAAGRDVGLLALERREGELFLESISLMPEIQGQGIGSRVITEILKEAKTSGLPVRLRVLKNNPARRLYERLGFRQVDEDPVHYYLKWLP